MAIYPLSFPTGYPLDLSLLKTHLRVDGTDEDSLIGQYLQAATAYCEHETGKALLATRLQQTFDGFPQPDCALRLSRGPVLAVTSVTYLDEDNTTQILDSSEYRVISERETSLIVSDDWPDTLDQSGSVTVTYWAGYASTFTVNATANSLTLAGWPTLAVYDRVYLSNSGGYLPNSLTAGAYYIKTIESDGSYTLSLTVSGATVDITGTGSGTHYLSNATGIPPGLLSWLMIRTESLYTQRGELAHTRGNLNPLPYIDRLLDPYRMPAL